MMREAVALRSALGPCKQIRIHNRLLLTIYYDIPHASDLRTWLFADDTALVW